MEPLEKFAIAPIDEGVEPKQPLIPTHMRVSEDVYLLGQQVAEARGFKNSRTAIETIVRAHAHKWINPG